MATGGILTAVVFYGSLSTIVGDEKLTSREGQIGLLFLYVQSDENTLPKVDKISKTEAQTFNIFDKLIGPPNFKVSLSFNGYNVSILSKQYLFWLFVNCSG